MLVVFSSFVVAVIVASVLGNPSVFVTSVCCCCTTGELGNDDGAEEGPRASTTGNADCSSFVVVGDTAAVDAFDHVDAEQGGDDTEVLLEMGHSKPSAFALARMIQIKK